MVFIYMNSDEVATLYNYLKRNKALRHQELELRDIERNFLIIGIEKGFGSKNRNEAINRNFWNRN